MNKTPLVSIIINNYNYGRFLKEAIDSALNQTYSNTEVIIVDDGSTDNSREIIKNYTSQIGAIFKENGGQASAFNAGFAASKGTIVLFLDADDMLLSIALTNIASLFETPEVVKAHWSLWEIDAAGNRTNNLVPAYPLSDGDLRQTIIDKGPASYATPPTSGNAWSRAFLDRVFPILETGDKHGADAYLCMLAPVYGTIIKSDEPQSCYRTHPGNFSGHNTAHRVKRDIKRFDIHADILAEHLRNKGVTANVAQWKEKSWVHQVCKAMEEVALLIPAGETLILVDQAEWGEDMFSDHVVLPFLEKNGQYWGPPADDEIAIRELRRLQQSGARFMVFTYPAFWWLNYYKGLVWHLRSQCRCLLENDRLVIFEL